MERISEEFLIAKQTIPGFTPRLDIIKANDRPDTAIYIRQKLNALEKVGFEARLHEFSRPNVDKVMDRISILNSDNLCHGILVQSPILFAESPNNRLYDLSSMILPEKDVDGLHPINLGKLALPDSHPHFYPCTPAGIVELLKYYKLGIAGKKVAILGRSRIVGMPTALILNRLDATVTLCHSQTQNLPGIISNADLVIAAIGKPSFVKAEWIKPGAVVIDVGINRTIGPEGHSKLIGDVDYERISKVAHAVTPVPGGVGPMTVAMLVHNLFRSALKAHNSNVRGTSISLNTST